MLSCVKGGAKENHRTNIHVCANAAVRAVAAVHQQRDSDDDDRESGAAAAAAAAPSELNLSLWPRAKLRSDLLGCRSPSPRAAEFLCARDYRSNQMAQHLATKMGFKKVWNVEGGLDAYAKQVDPSVGVY